MISFFDCSDSAAFRSSHCCPAVKEMNFLLLQPICMLIQWVRDTAALLMYTGKWACNEVGNTASTAHLRTKTTTDLSRPSCVIVFSDSCTLLPSAGRGARCTDLCNWRWKISAAGRWWSWLHLPNWQEPISSAHSRLQWLICLKISWLTDKKRRGFKCLFQAVKLDVFFFM